MATAAEFRKLALEQHEAAEKSHFEQPDFRVKGKIFATLPREPGIGVLKLPPELMLRLAAEDDVTFMPAKGFERGGWTRIRLANVSVAQLREGVPIAWAGVAPKRLVAEPTTAPRKALPKPKAKRARKR